jgi:hypothetical protein
MAMNENSGRLLNLKQKLPWISKAKIKEGIFVGSQVRESMRDNTFYGSLSYKAVGWKLPL